MQEGQTTPTANIASLVHIDTDVGAHETIQEFDIVDKNKVHAPPSFNAKNQTKIKEWHIKSYIRGNVLQSHFWRNIGTNQ